MGCCEKSVEGEDQRTLCFAMMTSLARPVKETFYSIWPALFVVTPPVLREAHRGETKGDPRGPHNFREFLALGRNRWRFFYRVVVVACPRNLGNIVARH